MDKSLLITLEETMLDQNINNYKKYLLILAKKYVLK